MPKIVVALAAFMFLMIAANIIMVWLSVVAKPDLVRSDYYDAGLEQDKIIARQTLSESEGMDISLAQNALGWRSEAGALSLLTAQCTIYWYRPDNVEDDLQLDLGLAQRMEENPQRLFWQGKKTVLKPGEWIARLVWEEDGKLIMEKAFPIRISG